MIQIKLCTVGVSDYIHICKLDFPVATFERFLFFQSIPLKQWKYLKSGRREIQFQQVLDIDKIFSRCVWIEDIEGYPNLDSYFAFNYLVCVGIH